MRVVEAEKTIFITQPDNGEHKYGICQVKKALAASRRHRLEGKAVPGDDAEN
jgi:hypothetical protein